MGWLAEKNVVAEWLALAEKMPDIPAGQFADASLTLISVFDLINGMSIASGDMNGNAKTIKAKGEGNAKTLKQLVDEECAGKDEKAIGKIAGDGKTATCALLWLVRALYFILKMLEPLVAVIEDASNPDAKPKGLSECVLAGYDVSLKPHHGFMIKGTFQVAVKAAPNRATFMKKLADSEAEVKTAIDQATPQISKMLDSIKDMLKEVNAKNLTSY